MFPLRSKSAGDLQSPSVRDSQHSLDALTKSASSLRAHPTAGGALGRFKAAAGIVAQTQVPPRKITSLAGLVQKARMSAVFEQKRMQAMLPSSPKKISARWDIQEAYTSLYTIQDSGSGKKPIERSKSRASWDALDTVASSSRSKINQMKRKLRAASRKSKQSWSELFAKYDLDGSGDLDMYEFFRAMYRGANVDRREVPDDALEMIFRSIDQDGNVRPLALFFSSVQSFSSTNVAIRVEKTFAETKHNKVVAVR